MSRAKARVPYYAVHKACLLCQWTLPWIKWDHKRQVFHFCRKIIHTLVLLISTSLSKALQSSSGWYALCMLQGPVTTSFIWQRSPVYPIRRQQDVWKNTHCIPPYFAVHIQTVRNSGEMFLGLFWLTQCSTSPTISLWVLQQYVAYHAKVSACW